MKHVKLYEDFNQNIVKDLSDIGIFPKDIRVDLSGKQLDYAKDWVDQNAIEKYLLGLRIPYKHQKTFKPASFELHDAGGIYASLTATSFTMEFRDSKDPKDPENYMFITVEISYDRTNEEISDVTIEMQLTRDGETEYKGDFIRLSYRELPNSQFKNDPSAQIGTKKFKKLMKQYNGNPMLAAVEYSKDIV